MKNLTGIWKQTGGHPADVGTYYMRQVADSAGNQNLYWFGKQEGGDAWSNVVFGTITGSTIGANWADVTDGTNRGHGAMTLKVENDNTIVYVDSNNGNGGTYFGGRKWERQ